MSTKADKAAAARAAAQEDTKERAAAIAQAMTDATNAQRPKSGSLLPQATPEDAPPAPPAPDPEPVAAGHHKKMPWDKGDPRVKKLFQGRLPEPLHIKLKYVQDHTVGAHSMHDLLLLALEQFCDRRIAQIAKEGKH